MLYERSFRIRLVEVGVVGGWGLYRFFGFKDVLKYRLLYFFSDFLLFLFYSLFVIKIGLRY